MLYDTNNSVLQTGKQFQVFHTNSFIYTQLNGSKHCYVSLTTIYWHTEKWFRVLRFNTNNSVEHYSFICTPSKLIKNQSFVYTQLNSQRVLFLTIWFNISHSFALSLNDQTVLFDPSVGPYQVLPLQNSRAEASPSDGLLSYPGHSLGQSYLSAEM